MNTGSNSKISFLPKRINNLNYGFFLLAVVLLFVLGALYSTRFYIPWPDETFMVEIVKNFVQHGFFGAPSLAGNGLKFDEKIFLYPPAYFLWLGSWFKVVHPSLVNARLLSNILGVLGLSAIFGIALLLFRHTLLPGFVVLLLVMDVHFAWLYNWARPDIMALACSYVAVWLYLYGLIRHKDNFLAFFTISWIIAVLGMMTHPVGGLLGFASIPFHLFVSRQKILKDRRIWFLLFLIPLIALALWGIYILQDPELFWNQFMDFQLTRKLDRFNNFNAISRLFLTVLQNKGIKSGVLVNQFLSPIVWIGLLWMTWIDKQPGRPLLMILILTFFSTVIVTFGYEMMYPPLRLPSYYLGLGVFWQISEMKWQGTVNAKYKKWIGGSLKVFVSVGLVSLLILAGRGTFERVWEVRYSMRAQAYTPEMLADALINVIEPGASLGVRIFPDCYDLLADSGHFSKVTRLIWLQLSGEEWLEYVVQNDYLAITDSALDPLSNGSKIDFSTNNWGGNTFREAANEFYTIHSILELPNGGTTIIYKRKGAQP